MMTATRIYEWDGKKFSVRFTPGEYCARVSYKGVDGHLGVNLKHAESGNLFAWTTEPMDFDAFKGIRIPQGSMPTFRRALDALCLNLTADYDQRAEALQFDPEQARKQFSKEVEKLPEETE